LIKYLIIGRDMKVCQREIISKGLITLRREHEEIPEK
jgi:hypothetical protein